MKKFKMAVVSIIVILLLFAIQLQVPTCGAIGVRHGPGVDAYLYTTDDKAFGALIAGEIDFMDWPLTYEQYLYACDNPDLQLAPYAENGMFQFDLNNNYTIADYPGIRNPLNDVEFRRALAHAVDRAWIVGTVINGFAEAIYCPLCASQSGYCNETCCNPDLYPFDLAAANARLDAAGFTDTDADDIRNYPVGWPGREDGPNLDPIKICIRSDHEHRLAAGRMLADNMRTLNIPVNQIEASADDLLSIVAQDRNYHIYTGSWSVGRYPSYLHSLFHSHSWMGARANYVTGMDASNEPNYPDLDDALEEVYYALDVSSFVAAVKKALGLLVCKYCVTIPLWSYKSWMAYSKYLVGIVNMDGYGLASTYTLSNAYKVDNPATGVDESQDPIRIGKIGTPSSLFFYHPPVLDRAMGGLMLVNPYNLAIDQPCIAQDWEETIWYDPQDDENKTKVTYWLREDMWWYEPHGGAPYRHFTAHDVEFSIWESYAQAPKMAVHHTRIIDDYCIEVYFDVQSMFAKYWMGMQMVFLPKEELLDPLCNEACVDFPIDYPVFPSDKMIFTEDQVIQVIEVWKMPESIPLVEGVDFEIFATGYPDFCHNEIHWLRPLAPGEWIHICYWTPDPAVEPGVFPVDPYDIPTVGALYLDYYDEGTGYSVWLPNPYFIQSAPPLGEIDWTWYWNPGPRPRSGYFQINLYDAVSLLKAYCTRGDTCPIPPNWYPGADIDPYDLCHVGIYDAVTLLGKYGQKFGTPP